MRFNRTRSLGPARDGRAANRSASPLRAGRLALAAAAVAMMTVLPVADAFAQYRGKNPGKYPGASGPSYNPPGNHRPGGPRPGGGRGPNWGGVATGIGIGIATGIILNAATANAEQPPPGFYDRPPGRNPPPPRNPAPRGPSAAINVPPQSESRFVPDEVVLEFPGNLSPQAMNALATRHGLQRLDSQSFALTNTTFMRARIADGRPVRTVLRALGREGALRAGQPNYLYSIQQAETAGQGAAPSFAPPPGERPAATPAMAPAGALPRAGDPAQYALAKLRLGEAHNLSQGDNVLIAVIDSGIDREHPELKGSIAGTFDALELAVRQGASARHRHGRRDRRAVAPAGHRAGRAHSRDPRLRCARQQG